MKRVIALVLLGALVGACNVSTKFGGGGEQVVGSGARKTERRDVGEFDRLVVEGAYRVEVSCGGGPRSLEIEADDNLLSLIRTDVDGGRLRIHSENRGMKTETMPRVRISVPDLKEVSIPGASDFTVSGLDNDAFKLSVEGASKFRASGATGRLDITLNGAGLVDARELRAAQVTAVNNGAGVVTVHASDSLDATVNGVGTVDYYGDPKTVNPQVNGIGRITKK
jgi:hypothetical protein